MLGQTYLLTYLLTLTQVLGQIDLEEGPDAPPIREQIAHALRSNSVRVLDLFREWDTDGDGEVTRKEFHAAMSKMGLEVPDAEVYALFDEWDKDGGGALDFKELSRILKANTVNTGKPAAAKLKAAGAASLLSAASKAAK